MLLNIVHFQHMIYKNDCSGMHLNTAKCANSRVTCMKAIMHQAFKICRFIIPTLAEIGIYGHF